jgi:hypothetical protein
MNYIYNSLLIHYIYTYIKRWLLRRKYLEGVPAVIFEITTSETLLLTIIKPIFLVIVLDIYGVSY